MKRKIFSILIMITMAVNLFPIRTSAKVTQSNKLVLIERWDGNWYAYETLAEPDAKGFMIELKTFAYLMGYDFWYTYEDNTVTLAKSKNRFITYKLNENKYTYQASSNKKTTKEAKYKTYCDYSGYYDLYYAHATTLGNLCYYKYFEGKDKTGEYGKLGFTSILCFSDKGKINKLPDIKKVKNDVGFTWKDTFISFDDIKEPGETEIFGLTFKAPEEFANGNLIYWDEDPEIVDIQSRFKEIVPRNSLANIEIDYYNVLKCNFNSFAYSFYYDLKASGGSGGFSITIDSSLNDAKKQMLKAICYKISTTPETLYNVIVYDYAKEAFIPEYDYRCYGDFKISASNIHDSVSYHIYPAK